MSHKFVADILLRVMTVQTCFGCGRNPVIRHDRARVFVKHHPQELLGAINLGIHESSGAGRDVTLSTGHVGVVL
jgi:hypothetical protein